MTYSKSLRLMFQGIVLNVEDLLFLESFQVKYLPERVPEKEFAVLLHTHPIIHRYCVFLFPPIANFFKKLLKDNPPIKNNKMIDENCQEVLWEIADLIVYNKFPEIYDEKRNFTWDIHEIISPEFLEGKIVIDAGAGSGKVSFMVAKYAKTVFAVEPTRGFRQFIKEKAKSENINNLFSIDGFLDSIPFPDNFADFLITSQAIGWNLEPELVEIERVLKKNGTAIHLLRNPDKNIENPMHNSLISSKWNYKYTDYKVPSGLKVKYTKKMNID